MRALRAALAAGMLALSTVPAAAQEWRLGTQFGRLTYPGASATTVEQSSLALTLSRSGISDWLGVSAAAPLEGGSAWGTVAAARRFVTAGRAGLGADLSGHAFVQRVESAPASTAPLPPVVRPGAATTWSTLGGGGAQAMAIAFARAGALRVEVRGGAAAHALSGGGLEESDVVPAADARLLVELGPVQAGPEAQHWPDRATWLGATARWGAGPLDGWANAGRWSDGGPEGLAWGAGAGLALPAGVRLEASYRHRSYDPVFRTSTDGVASVAASVRLGGSRGVRPPVPASYADGHAVIRLATRDVRGAPRIAGDFTEWKPVPMTRAGEGWEVRLPLAPGVYNYAFVTEQGEWFVPESTPGRRSDGMGGWVAVLVVSG